MMIMKRENLEHGHTQIHTVSRYCNYCDATVPTEFITDLAARLLCVKAFIIGRPGLAECLMLSLHYKAQEWNYIFSFRCHKKKL
jgi:hypothetical protein